MNQSVFSASLRCPAMVASLLLCSAVIGCGGSDRLKKQVSALESEITAMRADQDRLEERLSAVELAAQVPKTAAAAPTAERVERPRLKVIHLAPEDTESPVEAAAPEATPAATPEPAGHRPVIRGTGDRVIKVGDEAGDESTRRDASLSTPLAELGKEARGN